MRKRRSKLKLRRQLEEGDWIWLLSKDEIVGTTKTVNEEAESALRIARYINTKIKEKRGELEKMPLTFLIGVYKTLKEVGKTNELEITESKEINEKIEKILADMPVRQLYNLSKEFEKFYVENSKEIAIKDIIGSDGYTNEYSPLKELIEYLEKNPQEAELVEKFMPPETKRKLAKYITSL
ncbi:MAG: hypothetical protein DRP00_04510 [Candidatus Aenigmatarchaeota archaeon]|nr:MAG: hypothetical protein DRP00_04510 [Candidatus Aenigmarchaeota archaeon]